MSLLQLLFLLYDVFTNCANSGQESTLINVKEHIRQKSAVYMKNKLIFKEEIIQLQASASSLK